MFVEGTEESDGASDADVPHAASKSASKLTRPNRTNECIRPPVGALVHIEVLTSLRLFRRSNVLMTRNLVPSLVYMEEVKLGEGKGYSA